MTTLNPNSEAFKKLRARAAQEGCSVEEMLARLLENEDDARESQARYRVLFNTMLDGYALHKLIYDEAGNPADYRFIDINPAFEAMTGLDRSIIGKRVLEVLPGTEAYWIETYGNVVLSGEPVRFENHSSQVGKWFEVVAFRTHPDHFATIFQDITERKQAEVAERGQRALATALVDTGEVISSTLDYDEVLHRILDVIGDVVPHSGANFMMVSEDRHSVYITDYCACYQSNGLVPPPVNEHWDYKQAPHLHQMIQDRVPVVIPDTAAFPGWVKPESNPSIRSYVGVPITIDDEVAGLLNLDSIIPGFFNEQHAERLKAFATQAAIAIQNARLFQRLENYNVDLERTVNERTAELLEANAELAALSRVKDQFVSNVSHELRSPISSMMMQIGMVRMDPENQEVYIDRLRRETDRLSNLIEDLLNLSRLDQRRLTLELKPTNLNPLIEQFVADRRPMASVFDQELVFRPQPDTPLLKVDPSLVEQVLSILLTNALHYSEAGGQVTVAVLAAQNGLGGFHVRDTGRGIPEEEQARLFMRFFRGSAGHESGIGGTGLGLAIAQEIVQLHSGRIEVESTGVPGQGSTFRVWLPVART